LPGSGSPTVRRLELGAQLRKLREERGWTVEHVADRLMVSSSKVSRLETGQRGVSARDIRDLCDLYEVSVDQRQQLTELAAEGKQRAWWQPLSLPYTTYMELESAAASIQDYAMQIMPGLLQTADYAREVVRAATFRWTSDQVERRVEGRLLRQQILHRQDPPRYEVVLDEAPLHRVVGGPAVMASQLRHLVKSSHLRTVDVRVNKFDAGPLPAGNNKFIILRFAEPELPTQIFIEGLTGDLYLDKPQDVRVYAQTFAALKRMALQPGETRALLESMIQYYDAQSG
jgi:transcriptional regulator with XRE-family HTH domain